MFRSILVFNTIDINAVNISVYRVILVSEMKIPGQGHEYF